MTDLFISYSSHDEDWAKRLFFDLKTRFPTIKAFWARDVGAIPPGEPFRPVFEGAAKDATHFAVIWSAAAQHSNEVGPEIQAFQQSAGNKPKSDSGAKRRLFYIPVEHNVDYGGLADVQGYPEFRGVYDPKVAPDRGASRLEQEPAASNWRRMIGSIGDTVLGDQATQPITLALMVMTQSTSAFVDPFVDLKVSNSPSLREFLQSVGLTLGEAKDRYGENALLWRPFGTTKTIIDLMEDVRETTIRSLGEPYRFHWQPMDFVEKWRTAPDQNASRRLVESLSEGPSVIVTDPISLFNPIVKEAFKELGEYARKQQSMILSISPIEHAANESLYSGLLRNSSPVLNAYLYPQIPAVETFALCGLNIQHAMDVERVIRSGLGYYYLQKNKKQSQPLVSSGV